MLHKMGDHKAVVISVDFNDEIVTGDFFESDDAVIVAWDFVERQKLDFPKREFTVLTDNIGRAVLRNHRLAMFEIEPEDVT